MLRDYFKRPQRFIFDRKRHSSEENDSDDEYLFLDISTTLSTVTKPKTKTEALIGIEQRPQKVLDWFPVISIIFAVIICLITFIVLCKRQIDHRRYIRSSIKQRRNNRNNNQTSLIAVDVAECIDDDIEFVAGLNILLAKGSIILNDDNAEMLNSMNTFDRLQYFQKLGNDVK